LQDQDNAEFLQHSDIRDSLHMQNLPKGSRIVSKAYPDALFAPNCHQGSSINGGCGTSA
jgi:hypothetical protein